MNKVEHRKALGNLYKPTKGLITLEVPAMNFLIINGEGSPASKTYKDAVEALFALSYHIRFALKKSEIIDYKVMPLEGLWWVDDMSTFSTERKDEWKWRMMIMQPPEVSPQQVQVSRDLVFQKKGLDTLSQVQMEAFEEGLSVQTLHVGPFSEEGPTIERLHKYMRDQGYDFHGHHHEIYLSDIRRADPAKWKTIIRQPVQKKTD